MSAPGGAAKTRRRSAAAGGWDDPLTARLYRAFEQRHGRYRRANAALAAHAGLPPAPDPVREALRVLDLAAGTGGTTAALLPRLAAGARVDCLEPAAAMAAAGRARLGPDARVHWHRTWQSLGAAARFDRIVCGAALWQWPDLPGLLRRLARRLAPGGALVFDIPAAYLGQPDPPGGGTDPYLTALLAAATARHPPAPRRAARRPLNSPQDIERALRAAGLWPQPWQHSQRLSQAAWRDWLCLPVLTAPLWPRVAAAERARRIRAAARDPAAGVDPRAWRTERWLGWTAWKPAFTVHPWPQALIRHGSAPAWIDAARAQGAVWLPQLLPQRTLKALRAQVVQAAVDLGLLDRRGRWRGGSVAALHELPAWVALQQRVAARPEFQALVVAPPLLQVAGQLLGRPARGGLGSVCRIAPPESMVSATPPHRDSDYLRATGAGCEIWLAWLPLHACGVEQGVLAVAPHTPRAPRERGGAAARWVATPLQPGDVLLLRADTLHRACPNLRPHEARLSIDLRFGPA